MRPPLVLHLIDSLTTGGAEKLLKNSVNALSGFDHLVVFLYPKQELMNEFRGNIEFICLHHQGWIQLWRTARKLKSIIKERKPVLIHSHLFQSTLIARLATPASVPLLTTLHSTFSADAFNKNWKSTWAEKLTLKNRHFLVAVSKFVLDDYLAYIPFKGRSFVLYNFIPDSYFGKPAGAAAALLPLRAVAVGNLKAAKNYHYLLDVITGTEKGLLELDIYGEGPLRPELEERIRKENLPVRLCGGQADIQAVLGNYDFFIQASEHEGFGISVIEAMASGLPVFLSDIPVFHEVTNDFAYFFPLNDSRGAADMLNHILNSAEARERYVEKARKYCSEVYSEAAYKERLLEIYNHVISSY